MKLLIATGLGSLCSNIFVSVLARIFGFPGVLAGNALAYGGAFLIMLWLLQQEPEFQIAPSRLVQSGFLAVGSAVLPGCLVRWLWPNAVGVIPLLLLAITLSLVYGLALMASTENRRLVFTMLSVD